MVNIQLAPTLSKDARGEEAIELATTSLQTNALRRYAESKEGIYFLAFLRTSRTGRLKSLLITQVNGEPISD